MDRVGGVARHDDFGRESERRRDKRDPAATLIWDLGRIERVPSLLVGWAKIRM